MSGIPNPYVKTTISSGKSQGQINEMLRKYGCESLRWTELGLMDTKSMLGNIDSPVVILEFNAPNQTIEASGNRHSTNKQKPPTIRNAGDYKMHSVRVVVPVPEEKMRNQMYRALLYWLKNKLASVQFGFHTFEQEFFAFLVVEGGKTVYEIAGGDAVTGEMKEDLRSVNVLALPIGKIKDE